MGSSVTEPILFEIDGRGVASITLNQPERLNAINMQMRDLLWTYLAACFGYIAIGAAIIYRRYEKIST